MLSLAKLPAAAVALPNWLLTKVDEVTDLLLTRSDLPGGRPTASGKHVRWDVLFIRVKPVSDYLRAGSEYLSRPSTAAGRPYAGLPKGHEAKDREGYAVILVVTSYLQLMDARTFTNPSQAGIERYSTVDLFGFQLRSEVSAYAVASLRAC